MSRTIQMSRSPIVLSVLMLAAVCVYEITDWASSLDSVTAATAKAGGGGGGGARGGGRSLRRGTTNKRNKNNNNIERSPAVTESDAVTPIVNNKPITHDTSSMPIYIPPEPPPTNTVATLEGIISSRVDDDGNLVISTKDKNFQILTTSQTIVVVDAEQEGLDQLKPAMKVIITSDSGKAVKIVAFSESSHSAK